jgi:hypothetical protein
MLGGRCRSAWLYRTAQISRAARYPSPTRQDPCLVLAIGNALIEAGHRVFYTRTSDLVARLQAARRDLVLDAAPTQPRYDLQKSAVFL